ncbi:ZEB2-regulated ABC transporter 1 [Colletotrichum fructicola]|uniref:ZEB2-regulated ABC transporter 1 n=2 Tax=Colletotrichum fructicola (strain Nara gc5) TaxID=1213859 RepID=A0A7J6JRM7_COLFN|nr:ZEB2-regulated ABC transporter 1 [Colletotrichum fructicola]KAF4493050.1 ZEB2-regulated ABC transporter 1 [Colletotrichum fructicola Nara gc5]KAE9566150.1 ZEB2-regulated ABC transporter 1 [Colletotrichum fructicola]KAF4418655.1 ZEB2-regulated ABC transporter 1 [Colletotrichum fructicola]KAF4881850.1 ZEB2-regulated ABC transporter 1 [Colletotrichum fructicola]KAF5508013.1 ZEB2-regulated ABC transporter 1 [Colletotrichum fructicola]
MATARPADGMAENERPAGRSSRPPHSRYSLVSFPGLPSDNRPPSVHISADEYKAITDLVELAKKFLDQQGGDVTTSSTQEGSLDASKAPKQDGPLDPFGANFDAREWAKSFYRFRSDSCEVRKAGVAFRKLTISGYGADTAYQQTVGNAWWLTAVAAMRGLLRMKRQQVRILHNLEGVLNDGEMLCVLGPPGSGCSTFLRTIAGDTQGTQVAETAHLNYRGVSADEMKRYFKGDAIYTAEEDVHFPALSVADTLFFAARARAPKTRPGGLTADEYARRVRDVTMAMLGIQHTMETPVGGTDGDTVRGVSGGERKRVSIAEAALSFAPIQCWDNSTRGLDSAATVDLCKTLRIQSDIMGMASAVAIYQAPQMAYELFDKVLVLYDGRQIYFGKTTEAKRYFQRLGFVCPRNQTTPDFLTSMTSPAEREGIVKPGHEAKVPHTPDEFAEAWRTSSHRHHVSEEVDAYDASFSLSGSRTHYADFLASKKSDQSGLQRWKSPYTVSYPRQVMLCLWRALALLKAAPQMTVMMLVINLFQTLIVASIFFRLPDTAESMKSRSTLMFTAALVNAFGCVLEVAALYAKRDIVEKHVRYALYHASAEAIADLVMSLPYKLLNAITVNTLFYWMCNLRTDAWSFLFFVLVQFAMTLAVSLLFRLVASVTKSHTAAMAPSTIVLLTLSLYTGFAVPPMYYKSYTAWIAKVSPVAYGFEALMINEFGHGRKFPCKLFVPSGPGYENAGAMPQTRVCAAQGGVAGANSIDGSAYITNAFGYSDSHRWRNVGLIFVFSAAYFLLHLLATELVSSKKSKQEMLVFPRGKIPIGRTKDVEDHITRGKTEAPSTSTSIPMASLPVSPVAPVIVKRGFAGMYPYTDGGSPTTRARRLHYSDTASTITNSPVKAWNMSPRQRDRFGDHTAGGNESGGLSIDRQTAIFHWSNVCYEIKVKKNETKRILDCVDGWCEPGTLTALMGVSGAGKTTLLDALASRLSIGVVTGEMLVDGAPRDASFQQKTGYVKQQDQHLVTSTVREALTFSAVLRQPSRFSHKEKIAYVDKVIEILGMGEYADAVVGVPGEGLNVEQRKKLTIGVELAARPALLLFLDEPTSGLDSQTSLSICTLLETLRDNGQAILCTIHQPSAVLFERFDRLLLLARGGRTVYFGQIGRNAKVLLDYFVRNGGPQPKKGQNPAEYILDQVHASEGGNKGVDWPSAWRKSTEYGKVKAHLTRLKEKGNGSYHHSTQQQQQEDPPFAAPLAVQFSEVTKRLSRHYWRNPSYIYSKILLTFGAALFIGLSLLNLPNTQVGITIQTIAIFMFLTTHLNLIQQSVPVFMTQRTLYEGREQLSRTYSWSAFMGAQIVVEMAYNAVMAPPAFLAWYYLVGLNRNAAETHETAARGGLAFLFMLVFFLQASTFGHMIGAAFNLADQAAGIGNLLFVMMFIFNGILATPPKFWVWVYRVNPFTYLVEGLLGTGLANAAIHCENNEFLHINPPPGQNCGQYLQPFASQTGGYLADPAAAENCSFCTTSNTNQVLAGVQVEFSNRWRDLGILFAFVFFNAIAALGFYWLRVPKPKKDKGGNSPTSTSPPGQNGSSPNHTADWNHLEVTERQRSFGNGSSRHPSRKSRNLAGNSFQASRASALRSLRSSIMGGSQVLRDNAKRYWDDDGYDTDDTRMIDPAVEEALDTLNAGEEWEQDVPVEFIMQKPAAKPQYWI